MLDESRVSSPLLGGGGKPVYRLCVAHPLPLPWHWCQAADNMNSTRCQQWATGSSGTHALRAIALPRRRGRAAAVRARGCLSAQH